MSEAARALLRWEVHLEQFTLAWNVVGLAVLGIAAIPRARSVALAESAAWRSS